MGRRGGTRPAMRAPHPAEPQHQIPLVAPCPHISTLAPGGSDMGEKTIEKARNMEGKQAELSGGGGVECIWALILGVPPGFPPRVALQGVMPKCASAQLLRSEKDEYFVLL